MCTDGSSLATPRDITGLVGRIGRMSGQHSQARTYMYLLRMAHLSEVSVTAWPQVLKGICAEKNVHVLE